MRALLVQFSVPGIPGDWQPFDLFAGDRIPRRPVNAIAYQGTVFEGYDRLIVRTDGAALVIAAVCDDVAWAGKRWGRVVRFGPLAPDPAFGGAYNVRTTHEVYGEGVSVAALERGPWGAVAPFASLAAALAALGGAELAGALLSDADFTAHQAARSVRGWREWSHGVPAELLDSAGHVAVQRRPAGVVQAR